MDNRESHLDQGRIDEFLRLDAEGLPARKIAEQMHVTTRTVTRWRRRFDRARGLPAVRQPDEQRERARQIIADGGSFLDAARTIGVTPQTIRRWFPELPAWSKSQAGAYSVLVRQLNKVA